MSEKNNKKVPDACERCGGIYPKYTIEKNGEKIEKGNYPDCDCMVSLRLRRWQIPLLLGAIKLGMFTENLCSKLLDASKSGKDILDRKYPREDDSFEWQSHAKKLMDMISEQTGIDLEYMESAERGDALKVFKEFAEEEIYREICKYMDEGLARPWLYRNMISEAVGIDYVRIE